MWHNNVHVTHYFVTPGSQHCFAAITGSKNWKLVARGSADGVTNVGALLSAAHTNDRPVSVYVVDDRIERVMVA